MCDFQQTGGAPVRIRIIVYIFVSTDSADQNVTSGILSALLSGYHAKLGPCSAVRKETDLTL